MRVLLVNPPFYRLLGSHYNAISLGISYIASYLNAHGHDAYIYNGDYEHKDEYNSYKTIFAGFHDYLQFFRDEDHPMWEEVVSAIEAFQADWVGYTCYTANVRAIDIISRKLRQRQPNVRQVVGGVHATLDPLILRSLPAVDYAVRREGEHAMLKLVEGTVIQGVVGRNGPATMEDTQKLDLDHLPLPERDKFWNIPDGELPYIDVSYVCTIRGCPYRCNYCASPFHWKRNKVQYRSPASVLDELRVIKNGYWNEKRYDYSATSNITSKDGLIIPDNTVVYFVDDIFTVKKRRVLEIMDGMVRDGLNMPWKCEARADHLDDEICDAMAKSGCQRVKIGFESGSDRILRKIQKDEDKETMRRGAKMLKSAGIPFTAYFMAGFPGETDDDLRQTIDFAHEIDADYYTVSILSPYYGTKIYFDLQSEGFELNKKPWEFFYHQTGDLMVNSEISPQMLDEFLQLNRLNNRYL